MRRFDDLGCDVDRRLRLLKGYFVPTVTCLTATVNGRIPLVK